MRHRTLRPTSMASSFSTPSSRDRANGKVRPVFEIYSDSVVTQSQTFSGLVGAIRQVNDKLSFDAAVRYASVDGRPVTELRVGMTFGFPIIMSQPATAQAPFAGARRR